MGFQDTPVVCFIERNLLACYELIQTGQSVYAIEQPRERVFTVHGSPSAGPLPFQPIPVVIEQEQVAPCIYLESGADGLTVWYCQDQTRTRCTVQELPERTVFYGRVGGMIESDVLATKRVAIVGLGSFGSHIALELAKCGVGQFGLFDFDRLEPGNLTRHACGLPDVGRLKVNAVRDLILGCNPFATVDTFPIDVEEQRATFLDWVSTADLILCVTDENRSRVFCTETGLQLGKTVLYGRAITRAEGGDVLRFRPGRGPCLGCLTGKGLFHYQHEEVSTLRQSKRDAQAYMDADDIVAQVQVGLSTDIVPLWNMVVRLALVELMHGHSSIWDQLQEDLAADYYFWVNRRENKYAGLRPMQFSAVKPSILRWYGVRLERNPHCLICGTLLP